MTLFDNDADSGSNHLIPRGSDDTLSANCPSDMELLMFALDDSLTTGDPVVEHVRACNVCQPRITALRQVLAEIAARTDGTGAAGDSCLDETALTQLADTTHADDATPEQIAHLVRCERCRRELAAIADLLSAPQVEAEIRRLEEPSAMWTPAHRRFAFGVGRVAALAAAAVLLFFVWPDGERFSRPTRSGGASAAAHRAPTITASEMPVPVSPVGDVDVVSAFKWSSVVGSDRYRFTLYDNAGRMIYESQVLDTTLAVPDSVITAPGRSYFWQVEARNGVDRWTQSELVEFRVVTSRAP